MSLPFSEGARGGTHVKVEVAKVRMAANIGSSNTGPGSDQLWSQDPAQKLTECFYRNEPKDKFLLLLLKTVLFV